MPPMQDANPLVAMHCLAAADALVLPAENGEKPSSFALMAATLSRGSVVPSIEDLRARVARIRGGDGGEQPVLTLTLSPALDLTSALGPLP